jgi:hypothetical protein
MNLPPRLAALVVKNGVSLGLLSEADRTLVLALAATALDAGRDYREADVNRLLMAWLDGAGAMLRVDHVELRRWLVDAHFMTRDGFGHAYRRDPAEAARAVALLGDRQAVELDAEVAGLRAARAAQRESKRLAHAEH